MMVEKVVVVKEILVGMDGKDIQILNLKEVLAAAVAVLVVMVLMPKVQLMDPPLVNLIQPMDFGQVSSDKVDLVDLVELSLCLDLLL